MNIFFVYILAIVYCSTQIWNVFIAVQYYKLGNIAYFVIYIILVVVDKFFSFISLRSDLTGKVNFTVWILDFSYLGFLIPYDMIKDNIYSIAFCKMMASLYPMLLLQTFSNLDNSESISKTFLIVSYVNYVAQIIAVSLLYIEYKEIKGRIFKSLITHLSFYLTLRYMVSSEDHFGINLGYYCLLISIVNVIYLLFKLPSGMEFIFVNFGLFLIGNIQNYFLLFNASSMKEFKHDFAIRQSKFLAYFNQLAKFLIILMYMQVEKNWKLTKGYNIYYINLILAITLSIIFLLTYTGKIWRLIFTKIIIIIDSRKDYIQFGKFLQHEQKEIKQIKIGLCLTRQIISCSSPNENNPLLNEYCPYYEFQKGVSYQMKLKKDITVQEIGSQQRCCCKIFKLFEDEEHVHTQNDPFLHLESDILPILLTRIDKGFIFSETTNRLITSLTRRIGNDNIFQQKKSLILQFMVALKMINPHMVMQPQEVCFDLFDSNLQQ